MKKIGIIVVLFILTFSFSVNAEIFMEIDCGGNDITSEKAVTCEGNFVYEEVEIRNIEFSYETNLDIKFIEVSGFALSKNGSNISITPSTPLYDEALNSSVIVKFTLLANSNSKEKEILTLKNFKVNKSNEVEIEDVSETFNVTAPKPLSSDALLESITIDKVKIPNFDKNKFEYTGLIASSSVVFIDAVRSSDKSTATGLGQVYIDPGKTLTHTITVTAEDNTKKEYKLSITNKSTSNNEDNNIEPESVVSEKDETNTELNNDNTLKTLELFNGKNKIDFTFKNDNDNFNIEINDKKIEKLTIKATLNDQKATFDKEYGPRDVKIVSGKNVVLVKTKAENGSEKVYTLNITLKDKRDNDTSLKSLKINDEIINLVDKVYKYEITVPKNVLKTSIEAISTSEKAKVDYKDIDLVPGDNKIKILVTAENEDKKEYVINVIQSDDETVDNSLQSIKVEGYDFGFKLDKKEYTLKVSSDTNSLKIVLKPSNVDYEVLDNSDLQNGSVVTIKVGNDEYKIKIEKEISKTNPIIYIICGIILVSLIIVIIYLIRKKKNDIEII